MIMVLIRLHANIHTPEGLQGSRQSKTQIEPAAEHYWWAPEAPTLSCPKVQPQAVSIPLDMCSRLFWYIHRSGSFAFVPMVLPPFPLHCMLRMTGKHHHSLGVRVLNHHLPVLVLWWVEMSVYAGLDEYITLLHLQTVPKESIDLPLPPNLTSGSHFVILCLGFLVSQSRDRTTAQAPVTAASERLELWNPWCEQNLELAAILIRVSF